MHDRAGRPQLVQLERLVRAQRRAHFSRRSSSTGFASRRRSLQAPDGSRLPLRRGTSSDTGCSFVTGRADGDGAVHTQITIRPEFGTQCEIRAPFTVGPR